MAKRSVEGWEEKRMLVSRIECVVINLRRELQYLRNVLLLVRQQLVAAMMVVVIVVQTERGMRVLILYCAN